jgi:uncharacterized protein YjiS (DUF1127 family)
VNMQLLRRGITARPAKDLKVRSSLVRRLVQAQDDPAKHRIRAWLCDLDDEQLSSIGLTPEGHSRPAPLNFGTLRKPVATELTMLERNNSVPLSSFVQAERLARVERGSGIKACVRGSMRRFAEWLRVLGVLSIRLARDLAAKRVLRRAIRELHQLDDRMLADIGISRGEIEPAVRNGLPTHVTHTGASHHARPDTSSADLALFRNTPYRQGNDALGFFDNRVQLMQGRDT